MRILRIVLYILLIVVLQTVVFSRLNILDTAPDLFLVSIIGYAVVEEKHWRSLLFSFGVALVQGMLGRELLLNLASKLSVGFLSGLLKESFAIGNFFLMLTLVALFTPISVFFEGMAQIIFWKRQINLFNLLLTMLITTIYNLLVVPLLYPLLSRINHG